MSLISNIVQDKQEIKYQLSEQNPDVLPAAQLFTENIEVREIVTKLVSVQVAGAMIWGSDEFAIWGESEWGDGTGSSFILGSSEFGRLGTNRLGAGGLSEDLYAVVPRNGVFFEFFGQEDYIDTAATTATIDTAAESVSFNPNDVLQSAVIAKLRRPITSVQFLDNTQLTDAGGGMILPFRLGVDTFSANNVQIEFSNDSGQTWHAANESETFVFPTSSDDDELKYRITGNQAITLSEPIAIRID